MQRRLRIGINTLFLIPEGVGGSETYLRNLVRELPNLDPSVDYIVFTNHENAGTFDYGGARTVREVRCPVRAVRRPERLMYEYMALPLLAVARRIDLLFSPGFTAPLLPDRASVVNILDMQPEDLPENFTPFYHFVHTRLMHLSARTSTHILTLSAHAKRRIVDVYGVSPAKVTVSPLAAEAVYFDRISAEEGARVRQKYHLDMPYVLSVATLHPHKNLDALIDAFMVLRRDVGPVMRLVLVGLPGNAAAALAAKIRALGIIDEIMLTGWVPDADLPALYQGADAFVYPSRYEGFGIPVLEAMASGIPVITTNATSLPEVAGDAAILIDPDDHVGLITALRRVLTDHALRADLIKRGLAQAASFSWRKTAEITLEAFRLNTPRS